MQGYKVFCLTLEETDEDYGVIGRKYGFGLCTFICHFFNDFPFRKKKQFH